MATYTALNKQLDGQAREEKKRESIKYIIYAGATLVLFAVIVFSIKKLKK